MNELSRPTQLRVVRGSVRRRPSQRTVCEGMRDKIKCKQTGGDRRRRCLAALLADIMSICYQYA